MSITLGSQSILLHYSVGKRVYSFLLLVILFIVVLFFFDRLRGNFHRSEVIFEFDIQIVLSCSCLPVWRWLGLARAFRPLLLLRALLCFTIIILLNFIFLHRILSSLLKIFLAFLFGKLPQNRLSLLLVETRPNHGALSTASHP
jgi:hypothetical protein